MAPAVLPPMRSVCTWKRLPILLLSTISFLSQSMFNWVITLHCISILHCSLHSNIVCAPIISYFVVADQ